MNQEDLGFLTNQRKILILSLPSGTKSVVVNYTDRLKVSCVMPPSKRTILLGYDESQFDEETYDEGGNCPRETMEISCPDLLFTSSYAQIPMYGCCPDDVIQGHSIFVFNPKSKSHIEGCPYVISNVYASGGICFGDLVYPLSPQEAFNVFWQSPFNCDLRDEAYEAGVDIYSDDVEEFIQEYHENGIDQQDWEDLTEQICGNKFWASPEGGDALLVCSGKHLLRKIPNKFWRKDHNGYPFIVALGHKKDHHWEFVSGGFKFSLDKGFVTTSPRFSHKVATLKRVYGREDNTSKPLI